MLSGLWYEYLRNLETDMKEQGRRIALITDNAPTHPPPTKPPIGYIGPPPPVLDYVKLIYLPPNTTAWLQPLDAGIIRSLKAGYQRRFVKYIVDYFEKYGTVAPNLNVLQVIYMVAEAWDELPAQTIFHCWQKVGLVESIDREQHGSYAEYQKYTQDSTKFSIESLLDFGCNSQQVEDLTNEFLYYDEDAPDEETSYEDISLNSIITDLQEKVNLSNEHGDNQSEDDDEESILDSQIDSETITFTDADRYLDKLSTLLEGVSVGSLPTSGKLIQIPDAVQFLRKLRSSLKNFTEENKTQSTLSSWLQRSQTTVTAPELRVLESLDSVSPLVNREMDNQKDKGIYYVGL